MAPTLASMSPLATPAPPNLPPPPNYRPTSPGRFTGTAPTPTSYGAFTAPDPLNFQTDPSFQFRLNQGANQLQHLASKNGALFSGGTGKALIDYGQNAASQEYQHAYDRALQGYTTNRDTNAQNFGQQHTAYGDSLAGFNANTSATLGFNNDEQSAAFGNYDRAVDAAGTQQAYQQAVNNRNAFQNAPPTGGYADDYAAQVEAVRRANAAQVPGAGRPQAPRRAVQRNMGGVEYRDLA